MLTNRHQAIVSESEHAMKAVDDEALNILSSTAQRFDECKPVQRSRGPRQDIVFGGVGGISD